MDQVPHHHNGQRAHEAYPAPHKPGWFIRTWPYARAGLQLAVLVPEMPRGLRLATQALLVAGDLVAKAVTKHSR